MKDTQASLEDGQKQLQEEITLEQEKLMQLQKKSETESQKLKEEIIELKTLLNSDAETSKNQIKQLEMQLDAERLKSAEMLVAFDKERNEREAVVTKSTEISQQVSAFWVSSDIQPHQIRHGYF